MAYRVRIYYLMKNKKLINLLIKKNKTISSVESFTGGAFMSSLIKVPGASKVVCGGLITYQEKIKINLLKIKKKNINKYGVVSKEIAKNMVINGFKKIKSNIVISFTGNAGPGKEEGKSNVGDIYIGLKYNEKIEVFFLSLKGSRNDIIKESIKKAINILIEKIKEEKDDWKRKKLYKGRRKNIKH